jgi:hypothetical protein
MDKITVYLNKKQMDKVRSLANETNTDLPTALAGIVEFFDKNSRFSKKDSRLVTMVEEIEAIVRRAGFQLHGGGKVGRRVADDGGHVYRDAHEAAEAIGVRVTSIRSVANGHRKTVRGRKFFWVDEI